MGVSVSEDFLLSQQQDAVRRASKQGPFKTKHLNVWVQSVDTFLNVQKWIAAGQSLDLADFVGTRCAIGVDLSSRVDFTALTVVFDTEPAKGRNRYVWFPFLFLPESQINEGPPIYRQWAEAGLITVTPGEEIDMVAVRSKLIELNELLHPVEVPFDPWRAAGIEQECSALGVPMVKMPQTIAHFTDPMNELEAALESGRLIHDGNSTLNWMASNLTARRDTNGNCKPHKTKPEKKIDGMVSGIMATGRLLAHRERRSYLNDGDMVIL
jgi:phage terminase large subunit-like protein